MAKKKMSEDELRWQAEDDVRTLQRYQELIGDKSRLDRAIKQASKVTSDLQQRAAALSKTITGLKGSK